MKPAKLDATAPHDDTSANSVPPLEACSHAVLACSPGIPEEHYVSEAVEDAPSCRGYRDACTITGKGPFLPGVGWGAWGVWPQESLGAGVRAGEDEWSAEGLSFGMARATIQTQHEMKNCPGG